MKKNEIDNKITNALLSLMEEKEYKNISITDIVNKAGLSRVTYYRHFNDKEEIVIRYFEITKNRFIEQSGIKNLESEKNYEVIILSLFLFFKANIKANKCLRKAGLDGELLKFLSTEFLENLPVKLEKYVALFVAGALFNVLINWLDNDCKDSIEEVSKPFIDIQNALII
jgi:AcrR family transcriptional regulator